MISRRGRPASTRMGLTLQWASHDRQIRNNLNSSPLRVLPIPSSRLMPSGPFICMALPLQNYHTEKFNVAPAVPKYGLEGMPWRLWQPKKQLEKPFQSRRPVLRDLCCPSGRQSGPRGSAESNGGARQTLRTVRSGGHVYPKTERIIVDVEHREERKTWVWKRRAPNDTHSTMLST